MNKLKMRKGGYSIFVDRGSLDRAFYYMNLSRRVLIVTDDGVPSDYAARVAAQCKSPLVVTLPAGEATKCYARLEELHLLMLQNGFTRTDCVLAVGGGVVGDLSGFAAATYMRGIDFYNIPTTLLSMLDSSIGGKVAIDLMGAKNTVGAFYQPAAVVIDADLLKTLPRRQLLCGMAEAIKMSLTSDAELFAIFEGGQAERRLDHVILRALGIKAAVVEEDEREAGLRRVLNFGHTLGHAIEEHAGGTLLHGECVALGMLPMCAPEVRARLARVLEKLGLPLSYKADPEALLSLVSHDKKCDGALIHAVYVDRVGECRLEKQTLDEFGRGILAYYHMT